MNQMPNFYKTVVLLFFVSIPHFIFSQFYSGQALKKIYPIDIKTGAERMDVYLPRIQGKKIAIVGNQTSIIGNTHIVDTLVSLKIDVIKIFCPEHGFRGEAEAGEKVKSGVDQKTGIPIVSLYGSKKKPSADDLKDINIILFDMQDVGVRFYTYISTLHYIMEVCAENQIQLIILDRPNPNGFYVDGPILDTNFKSFIGMHPVPIVHGLTIGEYGKMINEEGWLGVNKKCDLKIITVIGYNHRWLYQVPVSPSPNLSSMEAIYLYPSLCLFEGTVISVGRGTNRPFQVFGHPDLKSGTYEFTPKSIKGMAVKPMFENQVCKGYDLVEFADDMICKYRKIYLFWLMESYKELGSKKDFFSNSMFDKLAGSSHLREMIIAGKTEEEIRKSWQQGIENFKIIRKKYLLYPDFE